MTNFIKKFQTFCGIIAIMAIMWHVYASYNVLNNWWAFPSFAILTAGLSLIITACANRFPVFNAIIYTGITLFFLEISYLLKSSSTLAISSFIIFIITVLACINDKHFLEGNLLLRTILCSIFTLVAGYFIMLYISNPVLFVIALFVMYLLILVFDVEIHLKSNNKKEKGEWIGDIPND